MLENMLKRTALLLALLLLLAACAAAEPDPLKVTMNWTAGAFAPGDVMGAHFSVTGEGQPYQSCQSWWQYTREYTHSLCSYVQGEARLQMET